MAQQGPAVPTPAETGRSAAGLSAGMISALAGAGLLVVFMAQNRQRITVQFLVWDFTWPLWLLILVSAVLGGVVWIGAGILRRHRRRKARRAARD
jgi:uncharacterized integral membrane protein